MTSFYLTTITPILFFSDGIFFFKNKTNLLSATSQEEHKEIENSIRVRSLFHIAFVM